MPFPSSNFVALFPVQELIVDKDSGEPLSNGVVTFYEDNARSVLKPVYKQVQLPNSTYDFVELNNPIILTSVGTFADDNGNDIIPFLYPYVGLPTDATRGALDLYYITVYAALPPVGTGALQFTREAWPPNSEDDTFNTQTENTENQISNPQFVEVNFVQSQGLTVSVSGTTVSPIAPDWDVVTTGTGTFTVNQIIIADTAVLTNPPYALAITSSNLEGIKLRQRITNSPRLLFNFPVATYFLAKSDDNFSHQVIATYRPSDSGTAIELARGDTNADDSYVPIFHTTTITGTANSDGADVGYVDFELSWGANISITFTSIQMMGVADVNQTPSFFEMSTPRQIDHLFHYWKPKLEYKPIPSYTIGWDFKYNPCQQLGTVIAATPLGANKSRYIMDQTIAFEAVSNVCSYTQSYNLGMIIATSTASQVALVQYLDVATAKEILQNTACVSLKAKCSTGTLTGTITLYWTQDVTLPVLAPLTGQGNSLVSGMTAGVPSVANGAWTKVVRSDLGDATFTLNTTSTANDFNGWGTQTIDPSLATFIAIVVGFNTITNPQTVSVEYCSLQLGDIPTRPAALSTAQTLQALQTYYEKSYNTNVTPQTAEIEGSITAPMGGIVSGGEKLVPMGFTVPYKVTKRTTPAQVQFYDPNLSTAPAPAGTVHASLWDLTGQVTNAAINLAGNFDSAFGSGVNGVKFFPAATAVLLTFAGANPCWGYIFYHFVSDARLGVA